VRVCVTTRVRGEGEVGAERRNRASACCAVIAGAGDGEEEIRGGGEEWGGMGCAVGAQVCIGGCRLPSGHGERRQLPALGRGHGRRCWGCGM
jgi:hypothetical protein